MASRRIAFLVVTAFLWCGSALAYWTGSTPTDGIELKEGPGSEFRTIRTLPRGTTFNATDRPQQGYYRIRTSQDSGWVDASQLSGVRRMQPQSSYRPRRSHHRSTHAGAYASYGGSDQPVYKRFAITPLVNYDLFTPSDLNNLINASDFSDGWGFGGEFQYFFNPQFAVGMRIEYISKSVLGSDSTTSNNFQFDIKSTSIAVGAEYFFFRNKTVGVGIAGYAGLAPTSFTSTDTSITTPSANVTEISATAFTFLGLLEGSYSFNETFAATLEAGYRYLQTSELQPSTTGAGNEIFVNSSGYGINLSGPILGIGGRISF